MLGADRLLPLLQILYLNLLSQIQHRHLPIKK